MLLPDQDRRPERYHRADPVVLGKLLLVFLEFRFELRVSFEGWLLGFPFRLLKRYRLFHNHLRRSSSGFIE